MLPQTERYLDLGRQERNHWWRYLAGVAIIAAFWIGLGVLPYAWLAAVLEFGPLADYLAVNLTIVMMLTGLALAMRVLHRRPLMSLVAPGNSIAWHRIFQGAALWALLAVISVAVEHSLYPDRYQFTFNAGRFFVFAAVALVLTPIQTTTEELVFRGYIMQGLATMVRAPLAVAIVSAAIFTVPHLMNPEMRYGGMLLAASYFTIGLLLAVVTLRDGRLELAIGVHAANNLTLVLVANYEGSVLATESVLTARELDAAYALVSLVIGAAVFYWWFFGRNRTVANATRG
ncbi:MAG: CPBP family intramembrane metalloprotease [Betaproteobacteria bacterium]|nr:CPBP family intramembrane metalloprotease [Betaproteobacteria bacterium]